MADDDRFYIKLTRRSARVAQAAMKFWQDVEANPDFADSHEVREAMRTAQGDLADPTPEEVAALIESFGQ